MSQQFPDTIIDSDAEFSRCILCGGATDVPHPVWLGVFRVLAPRDGKVKLYELCTFYHEVTLDIQSDKRIAIWPKGGSWSTRNGATWPVGEYFLFHERCWQYLIKCFGREFIGIEKLYDALRMLPPPKDPSFLRVTDYYPCLSSGWEELLKDTQNVPAPSRRVTLRMRKWCNRSDSFRCLPQELRHAIARLLPTRDFLNLRLASRTMTALFNEGYFWRSRFESHGDRGFLHHILREHGEDIQIDWRLLYHASAKLENRFDLTVPVWETVRWIQDTVKADEGSMERPLGFYGRSLQDYHNDTCAVGRRIERVKVPSSLAKIEVSFNFAESKPYPTEILALEFIDKDGTSATVGSKDSEADITKCRELFSEFTKSEEAKCRLDSAGLHALFDAQSFVGFRISYNAKAIYRIGILNRHHKSKAQPEILGYEPDGCSAFDMGLNEVVQVVATFESHRLVDLGLRGSGKRNPMYGRRPIINPNKVDADRYGWQFDEGADYTWLHSD